MVTGTYFTWWDWWWDLGQFAHVRIHFFCFIRTEFKRRVRFESIARLQMVKLKIEMCRDKKLFLNSYAKELS